MNTLQKYAAVLQRTVEYILGGQTETAGAFLRTAYPFVPIKNKDPRSYSAEEKMEQFFRDGFIDRYFGAKLLNPGMLLIFSEKLPGKYILYSDEETFEASVIYRDYQPSIDHIVPISRGGRNDPSNRVTTSVKGNSAKGIYTLDQLNWQLYPKGDINEWDGLSGLFVKTVEKYPEMKQIKGVNHWYNTTKRVIQKIGSGFLQDGKVEVYVDRNADVLKQAAEYIFANKVEEAGLAVRNCYSFISTRRESRSYSAETQMRQFFQDGFIDRYFGTKLINPGVLRMLSEKLPKEFPYHPHWKAEECHMAYWDFQPTMDHIVPITRGGKNDPSNWVTTSMKGNLAKKNYTLEQLNWYLYPGGDIRKWDGLSELFVEIIKKEPKLLQTYGINYWYKATKKVLKNNS